MAKNFIQEGRIKPFTCTADIASGAGLLIGQTFGITLGAYSNGDLLCQMQLDGVWELTKKTTDVIADGVKLYWDDTLKQLTVTVGSNKLVGTAWGAFGNGVTEAQVRLIQNGL